jgi:hypothetical protein
MAALDQYDKAKRASDTMTNPAAGRHRDRGPRRGPLPGRVCAGPAGRGTAAGAPPTLLLRPSPRSERARCLVHPDGHRTARDVPACAACAAAIDDGLDPEIRMVPAATAAAQPYWQAGPQYGGYASGYYGNSGMDLFSTILVGTMLGNMMTGGMYGGYYDGLRRCRWRRLRRRRLRRWLRWRGLRRRWGRLRRWRGLRGLVSPVSPPGATAAPPPRWIRSATGTRRTSSRGRRR